MYDLCTAAAVLLVKGVICVSALINKTVIVKVERLVDNIEIFAKLNTVLVELGVVNNESLTLLRSEAVVVVLHLTGCAVGLLTTLFHFLFQHSC